MLRGRCAGCQNCALIYLESKVVTVSIVGLYLEKCVPGLIFLTAWVSLALPCAQAAVGLLVTMHLHNQSFSLIPACEAPSHPCPTLLSSLSLPPDGGVGDSLMSRLLWPLSPNLIQLHVLLSPSHGFFAILWFWAEEWLETIRVTLLYFSVKKNDSYLNSLGLVSTSAEKSILVFIALCYCAELRTLVKISEDYQSARSRWAWRY